MSFPVQKNNYNDHYSGDEHASWEKRSQEYGTSINGVLFRNLPKEINEHIHRWHLLCIQSFLKFNSPTSILDVGCGYGRLSSSLKELFPLLEPVGVDISSHYIELFKKNLKRPGFVCAIEELPDNIGTFDVVLAVTVLMYVPQDNLNKTFEKLLKHLKPDGSLIIIEQHCSGKMFQDPFGFRQLFAKNFNARKKTVQTGGACFHDTDIIKLAEGAGAKVVQYMRIPITTIFIVPLYLISKISPPFGKIILNWIFNMSIKYSTRHWPTLHAAYLIKKE